MLINDLSIKTSKYRQIIDSAINRVLDRSWFIFGPEVKSFEQAFADYVETEHCLAVANGTDALEIGLRAVGVNQGDSVAIVANSGFYASTALLAIGANPIYLDVDFRTRVVTLSEVERAILLGVKTVVVTHLYGQIVPQIAEIAQLCRSNSVALIEDCAQSHGARINNRQAGSFGDVGCFSFYPTKNLGALGDGGAVVTNQSALAEQMGAFRQYGWTAKYQVEFSGRNSRLDEIQAAILLAFLPLLDKWNSRRREIALQYAENIRHPAISHPMVGKDDYVAHLYVITTSDRSSLQKYLASNEIGSDIHYPIPDFRQTVFKDKYAHIILPNTEKLAEEVLSIPCYPEMTDSDVQKVIEIFNNWKV